MGEDWKGFCERTKETTQEITSSLTLEEEIMLDRLAEYPTPKYKIGDLVCVLCPDYKHSIIIAKINCIILEDPKVVAKEFCQPIYILEGSTQQYYEEELCYYKR